MSTMNIKESIKNRIHNTVVNEIDWEGDFQDVKKSCVPHNVLIQDLQTALDRALKPSNKREKMPMNKPVVHRKNLQKAQGEDGEIDAQAFINDITQMPTSISSQNGKMQKTSKGNIYVLNTGLPALKGIVYDEAGKKFYNVNTCPGAGACALVCYARKGSFVQYDHVSMGLTRKLNFLLNHPDTYEKIVYLELKKECIKQNVKGIQVVMRWNDAGDFFAKKYWEIAKNVTKKLLGDGHNFKSYAYTKMGDLIGDLTHDITVNFSREANKRELDKVGLDKTKASTIVGKEVFEDLFVRKGRNFIKGDDGKPVFVDPQGKDELRQRLSKKYDVPVSSVVYHDELPSEEKEVNTFNAIVYPFGDSDLAASRNDVMLTFLLVH